MDARKSCIVEDCGYLIEYSYGRKDAKRTQKSWKSFIGVQHDNWRNVGGVFDSFYFYG